MRRIVIALLGLSLAACGGSSAPSAPSGPPTTPQVPAGVSALVAAMFQELPAYITSALAENQASLPRNPQLVTQITAKIALLQKPTLAADMSAGRMFAETAVTSVDGRMIAIAALFPEERMRAEAGEAVRVVERSLPVLESFMTAPFPSSAVRVWYGFKIGNSGGGGVIYTEDRTSYESRTPATRLPYDAVFAHELSHSYIGNEILTQFLEIYIYNRVRGATADLATWSYTRDYLGMRDDNRDSALTLDVYQLIGNAAMSRAYNGVYPLHPPYGQPLSAAVIQVFVDQAPEAVKTQVAAKLSRITF